MFDFFKRSNQSSSGLPAKPRSPAIPAARTRAELLDPLPLPEVQEGNLDSDWAMWEDSVLGQDSHPSSQYADTVPSQLDSEPNTAFDADPFAQVTRKAP